jgi:hypothetical protein
MGLKLGLKGARLIVVRGLERLMLFLESEDLILEEAVLFEQ